LKDYSTKPPLHWASGFHRTQREGLQSGGEHFPPSFTFGGNPKAEIDCKKHSSYLSSVLVAKTNSVLKLLLFPEVSTCFTLLQT